MQKRHTNMQSRRINSASNEPIYAWFQLKIDQWASILCGTSSKCAVETGWRNTIVNEKLYIWTEKKTKGNGNQIRNWNIYKSKYADTYAIQTNFECEAERTEKKTRSR